MKQEKTKHDYFSLFASCFPVRGAVKAIICDIDRNEYIEIPIDLYELLIELRSVKISDLEKEYDQPSYQTILQVINQLIENELGFCCTNISEFPPLSMNYMQPELINNSIVDKDKSSNYALDDALKQLSDLRCSFIQIRIFDEVTDQYLSILKKLGNLHFKGFELFIHANNLNKTVISLGELARLSNANQIVIHGYKENKLDQIGNCSIVHLIDKIDSEHHCGAVSKSNFESNLSLFTESHQFNNCLNSKISIDKNGYICNCPSLPDKFGKIGEKRISEVIKKPTGIKRLWNMTKDEIEVCKDCEFRYICTDCRAYTVFPEVNNSKPSKCRYNPYSGKWEE